MTKLPDTTIEDLRTVLGDALERNKLYEWKPLAKIHMAVGSRVTCNPPPTDTDEDWIVYDPEWGLASYLHDNEWEYGGSDNGNDGWKSYKKQYINVICICDLSEYTKFKLATSVAKELNLMEKHHRVVLFEAIMYGSDITGEQSK